MLPEIKIARVLLKVGDVGDGGGGGYNGGSKIHVPEYRNN